MGITFRSIFVVSLRSFSGESGGRNEMSPLERENVEGAMGPLIDAVFSRALWSPAMMAFSVSKDMVMFL